MPEAPELQAHAERLTGRLAGAPLRRFAPLSFTALKTHTPTPDAAVGRPLLRVGRRGKYLLLDFEPITFAVHLMQGGRLREEPKQAKKPRGGLARWVLDDRGALLLTEAGTEKRAGIWVLEGDPMAQDPLAELGPDAETVSRARLGDVLSSCTGRLHGVLRDQSVLAGLGRRLANEVCFRAKLSPFAHADKLSGEELDRLHGAIASCYAQGLEYERGRDDMSASKDRPGAVHHRKGEACPDCGDRIRTVEYSRYTVAYCPTCQTGGRVLADNTTSRFLK